MEVQAEKFRYLISTTFFLLNNRASFQIGAILAEQLNSLMHRMERLLGLYPH